MRVICNTADLRLNIKHIVFSKWARSHITRYVQVKHSAMSSRCKNNDPMSSRCKNNDHFEFVTKMQASRLSKLYSRMFKMSMRLLKMTCSLETFTPCAPRPSSLTLHSEPSSLLRLMRPLPRKQEQQPSSVVRLFSFQSKFHQRESE